MMKQKILQGFAKFIWIVIGLGLVVGISSAVLKVHNPRTLPITQITISGVPNTSQQQVMQLIKPYLNHGFFQVDIDGIRRGLEGLPWASKVEVERRWPNQLIILAYPQNIVATWNKQAIMNDMGEVFAAKSMNFIDPTQLPQLNGPTGMQIQALFYYQAVSSILTGINVKILQISLHDNGDCEIVLDNGIKLVLGTQDPLTRLQQFVKVYNKVFSGNAPIQGDVVDLRYSNGMAVQWGSH